MELATLIPLQYGCKRCVLVGDPNQLPATVISRVSKRFGYERSLFERLQQNGCPVVMLDTQYRMHHTIARFPSTHFYQGLLRNSEYAGLGPFENLLPPYAFFNIENGAEQRSGPSRKNQVEAQSIIQILQLLDRKGGLYANGVQASVGIITPYAAQSKEIRRTLFSLLPYLTA